MMEITHIFSSIYHPASNGMIERANQTIKIMLMKVTEENPHDWDKFLPAVLFAYRQTIHESTGYSPCQLMFGRDTNSPLDNFKEELIGTDTDNITPFDFVNQTAKHMQTAYKLAFQDNEEIKEKQLARENIHKYLRHLKV